MPRIVFSFREIPELVHQLRREVARIIMERSESAVHPEAKKELQDVAAEFDAGLYLGDDWQDEDTDDDG